MTISIEELNDQAGITLNREQVIWSLRYLAALTDPDNDSHLRHKSKVYREWRGTGRARVFEWADGLVYAMTVEHRGSLRDYIFELLAEYLPSSGRQ